MLAMSIPQPFKMRDSFKGQVQLQIYNTWMTLVFLGKEIKSFFLGDQKCECAVPIQPLRDYLHHCELM
jgi:hypothetical protein